jgi:hypothetical protein
MPEITPTTTFLTPERKVQIKSLVFTFLTDFIYSGLLGIATLVQSQDFTTAAFVSVGYAAFRTALRPIKEKFNF